MPRIELAAFESASSRIRRIPAGSVLGTIKSGVGTKVLSGMSRKRPHHDIVLPKTTRTLDPSHLA